MKFVKGLIVGLIMNLTSTISPANAGIFHPKTFTLSNGLQVVLIENHLAPVVSLGLLYKVGTADDPNGLHGLSHFLEHLMFKGTKEIPKGEFTKSIVQRGGNINAFTTADETVYICDIAIEHLDFVLKLEADRMMNLVFDPQEIAAELKVVLEERRMRLDNNPFGTGYEALLRAIFWYHNYGIPPIGYPQHILAYTPEAAEKHYRTYYAPNNAVLILSGAITLDELKPIVEKHFGKIKSHPIPERNRVAEPSHEGIVQELTQTSERISLVNIEWNYAAPNHRVGDTRLYYPLIVLTQILGGNTTSRLYRHLVEDKKLAIEADSHMDTTSYDPRPISVSVTLAPDITTDTVKTEVKGLLDKLVKDGVMEDELKAAKRDLQASLAFARDGNNSSVMAFVGLGAGFSIDDIEDWPNRINAVTVDQVNEAAKIVFGNHPVAIMTVFPKVKA